MGPRSRGRSGSQPALQAGGRLAAATSASTGALVARRPSKGRASPSGGGTLAEDKVMEQLRFLEAQDRSQRVVKEQKYWSSRLNELMGGDGRRATPSFPARAAEPPVASPTSTRSSPSGSRAPKFVGMKANEFAKAMSVDRIQRFREESARHCPTTRQLLTIDDSIDTAMAIRLQDPLSVRLKVDLFEPLEESGPEAAAELVLSELSKGLHAHVGQCKSYADGRWIEVILHSDSCADDIQEALMGLGDVTRKANLSTQGVMSAVQFDVGCMKNQNYGRYYDDEADDDDEDDAAVERSGQRHVSFGQKFFQMGANAARVTRPPGDRRGSTSSTTSRRNGRREEDEEEESSEEEDGSYRKLHSAIDAWDARLRASTNFQEAARRTRRRAEF